MPDIPAYLERLDLARRMARFYSIGIERTLFTDWATVCRWGRIGTLGQRQEAWFTTQAAAMEAACGALNRKKRRGYRTPGEWHRANRLTAVDSIRQIRATPTVRSRADRNSAAHPQYELDLG